MANIKVAVRVRPISAREVNLTGSEVVVRAEPNEISLTNLKVSSSKAGDSRERTRRYGFDYCFDSSDPEAENYADQAKVYQTLGQTVLDAVFSGYNSCLVAYGQSASGKTYTMMGTKEDPGLTPRLCQGLFARIEEEEKNQRIYRVSVSYLEIYNERVRDLLRPSSNASGLRVREHPRLGPYVQGLTHHVVRTLGSLMSYVEEGTRARKTASTLQNPSSSRSHALLTIAVSPDTDCSVHPGAPSSSSSTSCATSAARRPVEAAAARGGSKVHLVDLAGSESAATCSGVHRLKEGANINKSLVALGNVISALAERGSTGSGPGRRFIPYRDSSLTWLLKDALGGNATTIMLATISPASGSYNETAHTLRFAQRAQSVVNRPVVNEDPVARIIRELRAEVARLKSLLLEKNIEPECKVLCACKKNPTTDRSISTNDPRVESSGDSTVHLEELDREEVTSRGKEERRVDVQLVRRIGSNEDVQLVRRISSNEDLATRDDVQIVTSRSVKRYGSYELLPGRERFRGNYNRAKVTELHDEEDEISEIHESVFVDIPTLVAVLIKPDDSLQETSTQIEEICSDGVPEDSIDVEFLEGNDHEAFEDQKSIDQDERSSSVNSCHASVDNEVVELYQNSTESARQSNVGFNGREKNKFCKQDSIDVLAPAVRTNLHTSKRFGSVETIQRKKEPFFALERSHTNLEKRPVVPDRIKKLNNIREIEDQKGTNRSNIWRSSGIVGSKEQLQRKGSNDSDKSLKDGQIESRSKNYGRKPSLENLKRKTSKDSSSSSSKDEQILISSLTRDKLLRRKSSLEQEAPAVRTHTPIQRAKRAEIVAAVTERLYSSRKHVEDNVGSATASGIRSPPEGTDVKLGSSVFGTKSKLQELSRKMLSKRRRVCADTQTDNDRTVRVKDTGSLTDEIKVELQDAAVLTDDHADCEIVVDPRRLPVLRVKETSTLTDKPKTNIVRCRDVGSLANDLEDYEYEINSPRNDSGILSDDTQNYAESNLSSAEASDLCQENDRRVIYTESSTNTVVPSSCRSSAVQTPGQDIVSQRTESKTPSCTRRCCAAIQEPCQTVPVANSEKNVISISLPDMISITIESTNVLESRIAVMEGIDLPEEKLKINTREREAQTDQRVDVDNETESRFSFKDLTRSTLTQTDGRVFRIENIFQDPNNVSRSTRTNESARNVRSKNSVTFTNSLGTSYMPEAKENTIETEEEKSGEEDLSCELRRRRLFMKDGLITEAFIMKKRSFSLSPKRRPRSVVYNDPWKNWTFSCPVNSVRSVDRGNGIEVLPSFSPTNEIHANGLSLSCKNCSSPLSVENGQNFGQSLEEKKLVNLKNEVEVHVPASSVRLEANGITDHEYNFSDDSLDYNENNVTVESTMSKSKSKEDRETRENLCPPDVVAHTKKETPKSSNPVENVESSVTSDFEDSHVEFPKKKPGEAGDGHAIHDYKSLILGKPYGVYDGEEEDSDARSPQSRSNGSGKKKVSFSSSNVPETKMESHSDRKGPVSKSTSSSSLKSIIKKKKKIESTEPFDVAPSSNDETDDSLQEDKSSLTSDEYRDWRDGTKSFGSEETSTSKEDRDSNDSIKRTRNSKRVKFSTEDRSSENTCSESDSNGNAEDEEDEELCGLSRRNVLEEYLSEAVTFMRNMNSINEYMSATRTFEKYLGRNGRRGGRRRTCCNLDQDYVEFKGRKVSLKDDTDKYLKEDEDIVVPTESYERCLRGIQRLESCIRKVDRQNELLREKYGINCESAGARLRLASPCIDLDTSTAGKKDSTCIEDVETIVDYDIEDSGVSFGPRSSLDHDYGNNKTEGGKRDENEVEEEEEEKEEEEDEEEGQEEGQEEGEEDIERRIFEQLMNAADSSRYWSPRKVRQGRFSRMVHVRPRSPTTYSKFREKFMHHGRESFSRDVRGIRNSEESSVRNDDRNGEHERTTEKSRNVERTRLTGGKIHEDHDSVDYDTRFNYNARSTRVDGPRERNHDENLTGRWSRCDDSKFSGYSGRETKEEREDGLYERTSVKTSINIPMQRGASRNGTDRTTEIEEYARRNKEGSTLKVNPLSRTGTSGIESWTDPIIGNTDSIEGIAHFRDKLKYPGSPRARFLELLRERRRIVESSRATSAS